MDLPGSRKPEAGFYTSLGLSPGGPCAKTLTQAWASPLNLPLVTYPCAAVLLGQTSCSLFASSVPNICSLSCLVLSQGLVTSFSWPSMNSHWASESQWEVRWWPLLIPGQRVHSEEGRPESSHSYRSPLPRPTVWPSGPRPGGSLEWASSVTPLPQAFPTLWLCRLVLPLEHTITPPCSDTGFGGDHKNPGGKARLCPGGTGHSERGELKC